MVRTEPVRENLANLKLSFGAIAAEPTLRGKRDRTPTYNARKTYTRNDHGSSPFKNPTHASDSIVLSSMWTTVQGPPPSKKNSKRRATRAP